jgi:hypothetical protein
LFIDLFWVQLMQMLWCNISHNCTCYLYSTWYECYDLHQWCWYLFII